MEQQKIDAENKVVLDIAGLDALLYGGLYLPPDRTTVIAIKGGPQTDKTLFGLQLIYRVGLMLKEMPYFYSECHDPAYLEDLLLDTVISSCIRSLINLDVQHADRDDVDLARTFFNTEHLPTQMEEENSGIPNLRQRIDQLICHEIVHYSNRTNALHRKTLKDGNDKSNLLYERKYDRINAYYADSDTVFDVINAKLGLQCGRIMIAPGLPNWHQGNGDSSEKCVVVELSSDQRHDLQSLLSGLRFGAHKWSPRLLVLLVDERTPLPEHLVDLVFHLVDTQEPEMDYRLQRLCIEKSDQQTTQLGWHQYKCRDYGIEIYPSLHSYFMKRRYLERALIYTHSSVASDTFQQYMDYCKRHDAPAIRYSDYDARNNYLEALFPNEFVEYTSEEVLNMILLNNDRQERCDREIANGRSAHDIRFGDLGEVTGIIGDANTYKRFLSIGSMFGSAVRDEHSLILMLNQETPVIHRRLPCPASILNGKKQKHCDRCFDYIHFMNFRIGCITPDEFIYFLVQQIEAPFRDGKRIRRIILDNLQVVDFCFPFLKKSPLFLPALMSVCRERNIALYILCDKMGELVDMLRALADNIVCTERTEEGTLQLYVERFSQYNFSPSKIYCAEIRSVKRLFECSKRYASNGESSLRYTLNPDVIEDYAVHTMEPYWHHNHK